MKIYVAQFYLEAGASYPLTYIFQGFIHEKLTDLVKPSSWFFEKYGPDFTLIFRVSAKSDILEPEIKGPGVFKKTKHVEYTIFLTFDKSRPMNRIVLEGALKQLLDCIMDVLERLEMKTDKLKVEIPAIISTILSTPEMIEADELN